MSIRTVAFAMEAKAAAFRNEYNGRAILAYNIAALSRAKRLPKVETLFAREHRPKTWQESNAMMEQWYRAQEARKRRAAKGA